MVKIKRRLFLSAVGLYMVAPALLLPSRAIASDAYFINMYNTHTKEYLSIQYRMGDELIPSSLIKIDHLLRDSRTGEKRRIDPHLYDTLHDIAYTTGTKEYINVVSGYRSKKTNEMLRRKGVGVAKDSFHMKGMAIDIRLPDVSIKDTRDAALELKRGGVGYYPKSQFVHIDTGSFRQW